MTLLAVILKITDGGYAGPSFGAAPHFGGIGYSGHAAYPGGHAAYPGGHADIPYAQAAPGPIPVPVAGGHDVDYYVSNNSF